MSNKGFTLIELLITIVILSILMLLVVPKYIDYTKGSRIRTFEINTKSLISSMNSKVSEYNGNAKAVQEVDVDVSIFTNKPIGSSYVVTSGNSTDNAILIATLSHAWKDGNSYIITYDSGTQEIKQYQNSISNIPMTKNSIKDSVTYLGK